MNRSPRILCIDDFTSQLNTLKSTLEDRGYEVWTAKNLADGHRIAECLDFEAMMVAQRLATLNPDLACGLAARPSLFLTYRGNSFPSVNCSLTPNFSLSSESVEGILAFLPMLRRRTGVPDECSRKYARLRRKRHFAHQRTTDDLP